MNKEGIITLFRTGLPHFKINEIVNSLQVRIEGKKYVLKQSRQAPNVDIEYTNIEDYINFSDIFKTEKIDSGEISLDWLVGENVYIESGLLNDLALIVYERYRSGHIEGEPVHLIEVIVESYDWIERKYYTERELLKLEKYEDDKFLNKMREGREHATVLVNITPFASRKLLSKTLTLHEISKLYPDVKTFKNQWLDAGKF